MKKIVFGTVLLCMMGLSSPIVAQDSKAVHDSTHTHKHCHKHGGHHSEGRLERLQKELDLSNEQSIKVKEAFVAHHQKMKAGKDLSDAERKNLHQTSKQELDTQIKGILTEKQYIKYQAKMKKMKKRHGKKHHCKCK